jgi:hypothetical protein
MGRHRGTYSLDSGFAKAINDVSSESLTIRKDTNGAVWATWTQVAGTGTAATGTVYLNSLTSGAAAWGAPCSWAGWERTPPPSG